MDPIPQVVAVGWLRPVQTIRARTDTSSNGLPPYLDNLNAKRARHIIVLIDIRLSGSFSLLLAPGINVEDGHRIRHASNELPLVCILDSAEIPSLVEHAVLDLFAHRGDLRSIKDTLRDQGLQQSLGEQRGFR